MAAVAPLLCCLAPVLVLELVVLAVAVGAQPVALGGELVVNGYTTGNQFAPSVAGDGAGRFVVVWTSVAGAYGGEDGSIRARRYDATGSPAGTEFEVTASDATGGSPRVAMAADGSFVVVWTDPLPQILARAYDDSGAALGDAFRVDTTLFDYDHGGDYHGYRDIKEHPAVAAGSDGRFMVVWAAGTDEYLYFVHDRREIRGQVIDASGSFVGTEFNVGGSLYYKSARPDVAATPQGEFVVVWSEITSYDYGYGGEFLERFPIYEAQGRRLDATGAQMGSRIVLGEGSPYGARVATDMSGGFVVAWGRDAAAGGCDVVARRYDALAVPLADAFQVSPSPSAGAGRSGIDVAMAEGGSFAVVWAAGTSGGESRSDGSELGVLARAYAAEGAARGTEIVVNAYTTADQSMAAITFVAADTLVAAWASRDQDGSGRAVVTRRFARAPACGDSSADGDISATDALIALGVAVGLRTCAPCVCDADASGVITATDALSILRAAGGQPGTLRCAPC